MNSSDNELTIKRSESWHYRWYAFCYNRIHSWPRFKDNEPESLCPYVRGLIGNTMVLLFYTLLALAAVALLPVLFWSAFHNHAPSAMAVLKALAIIIAVSAGVTTIVFGGFLLFDQLRDKHKELTWSLANKSQTKKSLTAVEAGYAYIQAIHKKVCPPLKFE